MEAAPRSPKRLKASAATFVNWAELLPEILPAIAERVGVYEDFMAFRGVCKSWRSATAKTKFNPSQNNLPWLMLAEEIQAKQFRYTDDDEDDIDDCEEYKSRKFFSLSKKGMILSLELPEARFKHCTSSLGWLITTDDHGKTELLHPLTRSRIPLPHVMTFKYFDYDYEYDYCEDLIPRLYIRRATLSACPSVTNDYILMVILGDYSRLAYWKPGDKTWNAIESRRRYDDVLYYKNQFVTVDHKGRVDVCNIHGPNPDPHNALGRIHPHDYNDDFCPDVNPVYLVELAGKLLAVTRHKDYKTQDRNDRTLWTTHFRVYEYDGSCRWQVTNSLKGRSVFLGHNTGFSCNVAAAVEETMAIKPNCIYFTDDCSSNYRNYPGSHDMGVYRLEDKLVDQHYLGDQWCSRYCPPLWVMPSF